MQVTGKNNSPNKKLAILDRFYGVHDTNYSKAFF